MSLGMIPSEARCVKAPRSELTRVKVLMLLFRVEMPSALSRLKMRIGWLGLSGANPQKIAVWGLTEFDPSHPKIKL